MPPRTILVTGAPGFVGQALLPVLRRAFPQADIRDAAVDITDAAAVTATIATTKPDALVHLAAIAAPADARADPGRAWRVNLHGSLDIGRAILAEAPDCTMLFVSSADAYGASFRAGTPLDETAPLAPLNDYGATKAAADLALGAMAANGLRVIRARPFNHTGPGQSDAFVVPAFAAQIARIAAGRQDPVMDVGALHPFRDFLDVSDVCAAYAAILARADTLPPGTILNIASGQARRIGDVLQDLMDLAGITAEIRTAPTRLRPTDIPTATGDATLAKTLLDWHPKIPWPQTLTETLAAATARQNN